MHTASRCSTSTTAPSSPTTSPPGSTRTRRPPAGPTTMPRFESTSARPTTTSYRCTTTSRAATPSPATWRPRSSRRSRPPSTRRPRRAASRGRGRGLRETAPGTSGGCSVSAALGGGRRDRGGRGSWLERPELARRDERLAPLDLQLDELVVELRAVSPIRLARAALRELRVVDGAVGRDRDRPRPLGGVARLWQQGHCLLH